MFLHEIFHQGLKARIANWPTLVLGKLLFNRTQNTNTLCVHAPCSHSITSRSGFQWSPTSSLSYSNVRRDVLLPHSSTHTQTHTHTLISLSQSATNTLIVCQDNDQLDQKASQIHLLKQKPPPQTDKHHQGDRLLNDTTANYL